MAEQVDQRVTVIFCDMQNDIMNSLPDETRLPVMHQCSRLLETARRTSRRVIFACSSAPTRPSPVFLCGCSNVLGTQNSTCV